MNIGGRFWLTHILFVDDILIFCDGSIRDMEKILYILELFFTVIGMKANEGKSNIPTKGIKVEDMLRYEKWCYFRFGCLFRVSIAATPDVKTRVSNKLQF